MKTTSTKSEIEYGILWSVGETDNGFESPTEAQLFLESVVRNHPQLKGTLRKRKITTKVEVSNWSAV